MPELSILIPARNEMFLRKTVEDLLEHIRADTEIIVVLDGAWADPTIDQDERVTVVHLPQSIGQRAACNMAARLARGKYVMKVDAHCSFAEGFDTMLLDAIRGHDNWTVVPKMKNLWAFDWVCAKGHRRYQSPSGPCTTCQGPTERVLTWKVEAEKTDTARGQWKGRKSPTSTSYCFDPSPHFQYFGDFAKRPEGIGDVTPTMSLQGSCFLCTKERYFALNLCDEAFGSWGSQGIEVAGKTWLSGGEVRCCQKTWYAHLFRTQGKDFGFPYKQNEDEIARGRKAVKDMFVQMKAPHQIHPLSWLVKKFWPVKGWEESDLAAITDVVPRSNDTEG